MAKASKEEQKTYGSIHLENDSAERLVIASFSVEKQSRNPVYPLNWIRTTKYTILSFIPKNLFEQFHRLANFYFLFIVILNFVPQINAFGKEVAMLPLLFVLIVTALKDIIEDRRRYLSDREINKRNSQVYDRASGEYHLKYWKDICVGDIVKLECNDIIPADLLVLWSSEQSGLCHIETSNIDGETNLKQRLCPKGFLGQTDELNVSMLDIEVHCEKPNNSIYQFNGRLIHSDGTRVPLDSSHLLLRGCVIRNTECVLGLVIYAGHDTKSMMNNSGPRYKRSKVEKAVNKDILWCIVILLALCLIGAIGDGVWLSENEGHTAYLPTDLSPAYDAFLRFWTYIIVLQIIIPISLYVSLEIVKLFQVFFIQQDLELYYAKSDTPAHCRALNINEDLGQIEYIFSDKTGTLTENRMVFRMCSIARQSYGMPAGSVSVEEGEEADAGESRPSSPPPLSPNAVDVDSILEKKLLRASQELMSEHGEMATELEFFILMAICNTVVVAERKLTESILEQSLASVRGCHSGSLTGRALLYEAESPDEAALVQAAKAYGVRLVSRDPQSVVVALPGFAEPVAFPLLHVLRFDSERKRMSVIVRDPFRNEIVLYCKGADAALYGLLRDDSLRAKGTAEESLHAITERHNDRFARLGLRTLCIAKRVLSETEYEEWLANHEEAERTLVNRDFHLQESARRIERNLELMGATGVEDRLQDGVSDTIGALREAGMVVWVLTGDKQETAVNIAFSSQLFDSNMEVIKLNAVSKEECQHLLKIRNEELDAQERRAMSPPLSNSHVTPVATSVGPLTRRGLVIDGQTLDFALEPSSSADFLQLARRCQSVVCCRSAPIQKAAVVQLVKEKEKVRCLAIGDGANDVSMIQMADVGVGISGNEGMQAVMASDFTFGRFRFLKRLLLVHGHWSYDRLSKLILYLMYKNAVYVFLLFGYQFYNGWSSSVCIEQFFLFFYNLVFTSLPIIVVAILDQDLKPGLLEAHPFLYEEGRKGTKYTRPLFWLQIADAMWQSLAMFYVSYWAYADSNVGRLEFGTTQNTACVITVTLHLMLEMHHWTWIHHLVVWGSLAVYFIWALSYDAICCFPGPDNAYWVMEHALGTSNFWLCILLTPAIALLPRLLIFSMREIFFPSVSQMVRKVGQMQKGGLAEEIAGNQTEPSNSDHSSKSQSLPVELLGVSTSTSRELTKC